MLRMINLGILIEFMMAKRNNLFKLYAKFSTKTGSTISHEWFLSNLFFMKIQIVYSQQSS